MSIGTSIGWEREVITAAPAFSMYTLLGVALAATSVFFIVLIIYYGLMR